MNTYDAVRNTNNGAFVLGFCFYIKSLNTAFDDVTDFRWIQLLNASFLLTLCFALTVASGRAVTSALTFQLILLTGLSPNHR